MIKLINGRGQLGDALQHVIQHSHLLFPATIYHTWNFLDKSESRQREEFDKFASFVNTHKEDKIIFISTYSKADNPYVAYKRQAEKYLFENNENSSIIRLPNLIGKGICQKFKEENVDALGNMEIMTIHQAALDVLGISQEHDVGNIYRVQGHHIPAYLVKELIQFGAKK